MQYKAQHFVPKCYMRAFSVGGNGKSICLYNIKQDNFAINASVKDQCARSFFYDRTGKMEKIFGEWEGQYSSITKSIRRAKYASESELTFLRQFAYLQYLRTEAAAKDQALAFSDMTKFLFNQDPEGREWAKFDPNRIPAESFYHFIETKPFLMGLHDCLVQNHSKIPFITSDNPSVIINRFYIQRKRNTCGGDALLRSGCMLILPLSPEFAFVSYDQGIYTAILDGNRIVHANRQKDIDALNALQIVRADKNVYFDRPTEKNYAKDLFIRFQPYRPTAWHKLIFSVGQPYLNTEKTRIFNSVGTPDEFSAGDGLMHWQSISVNPGIWCSLFSFRSKPKYFDTHSGPMRSVDLLNLSEILQESHISVKIPRKSL